MVNGSYANREHLRAGTTTVPICRNTGCRVCRVNEHTRKLSHATHLVWGHVNCVYFERAVSVPNIGCRVHASGPLFIHTPHIMSLAAPAMSFKLTMGMPPF